MKRKFNARDGFFLKMFSRRQFFKFLGVSFAVLTIVRNNIFSAFAEVKKSPGRKKRSVSTQCDLAMATGDDPYVITQRAIQELGGMSAFVKNGDTVVIKPNMGWDRTPEQAANTNPFVVAAIIDECFRAGARRVNVFDNTCNDRRRCYEASGIAVLARQKGAMVYFPESWDVVAAHFDYESPLEGWPVYRDALTCDVFINVPVLKHHGLTNLTLSMKNLMGVCDGNRGIIHQDIARKLVDLTDFIKPDLTVIDAYRVLIRNGPTGGNLADVIQKKTVFASHDPTLADSYAARFLGIEPTAVSYIAHAIERNFGITSFERATIKTITV